MPCIGSIFLEETHTTSKYLVHLQNHVTCLFNSVKEYTLEVLIEYSDGNIGGSQE